LIYGEKKEWNEATRLGDSVKRLIESLKNQTNVLGNALERKRSISTNSETITDGVPTFIGDESDIIPYSTFCDVYLVDGSIDETLDDGNELLGAIALSCGLGDVLGGWCGQNILGFNMAAICTLTNLACSAAQFLNSQINLCCQLLLNNEANAIYRRAAYALENQYIESTQLSEIQTTLSQLSSTNTGTSSSVGTKELKRVALEVTPNQPGVSYIVAGFIDFAPYVLSSLCLKRYSNNTELTVSGLNTQGCTSNGLLPIFSSYANIFTLPLSAQYQCLQTGSWETMVIWDGTTGKGQTWVNLCSSNINQSE